MAERPTRSDIVVHTIDPVSQARLRAALQPLADVVVVPLADAVREAVSTRRVAAIVIELGDPAAPGTVAFAAALRRDFPSIPILVYCALHPDQVRVLPALVQAGVDRLIIRDVDDEGIAVRHVLALASADRVAMDALRELGSLIPPEKEAFVAYCLAHTHHPLRVCEVARALTVHRKTLCQRSLLASFPSPSEVISWCRLLHAARLLDDTGRSVEGVALMLGFSSGAGLRNMLRRYTGLTPTAMREHSAFATVMDRMRERIRSVAAGTADRRDDPPVTQRPARRAQSPAGVPRRSRREPPRSPASAIA